MLSHWVRKADIKSLANQIRDKQSPSNNVTHSRGSAWVPTGIGLPPLQAWGAVSPPPRDPTLRACPLVVSTHSASRAGGHLFQSRVLTRENWVWVIEIMPSDIPAGKETYLLRTHPCMASETTAKAIEWLLLEVLPKKGGKVKIKVEEH